MSIHPVERDPIGSHEYPLPRAEALTLANTARELYRSVAEGIPFGNIEAAIAMRSLPALMAPSAEFVNAEHSERLLIHLEEWPNDKDTVLLPRDLRMIWSRRQQTDGITKELTELFGINRRGMQWSMSPRQETDRPPVSLDIRVPLMAKRPLGLGPGIPVLVKKSLVDKPAVQGLRFQEKLDGVMAIKGQETTRHRLARTPRLWLGRHMLGNPIDNLDEVTEPELAVETRAEITRP
jgi:hypothetical protein